MLAEFQAGNAALMSVIIALVVHPVVIVGQDELRDHSGFNSDKNPLAFVVVAHRCRRCAHVMTNRRPELTGVPEQPNPNRPKKNKNSSVFTRSTAQLQQVTLIVYEVDLSTQNFDN